MRMRKKKNADARLASHEGLVLEKPSAPIQRAEGREIYLEIGAGKGGFAIEMAKRNPNADYFAMERVRDCIVIAVEKADAEGRPENLRFLIDGADNLPEWFAAGSVDRIFLNFSDPWHKKGYFKRRLTYRKYLALYFTLLREGGELCFKTDNAPLFDFSLEEIASVDLTPYLVTRDLHASPYAEGNVMTEYEKGFVAEGLPIHKLCVKKPEGYIPHYEEPKKEKTTEENA
jgi:tRNA (guanine-N7-)-methyltransferase